MRDDFQRMGLPKRMMGSPSRARPEKTNDTIKHWNLCGRMKLWCLLFAAGASVAEPITAYAFGWKQNQDKQWSYELDTGEYIQNIWFQDPQTKDWYLFDEHGTIRSGWVLLEHDWYFLNPVHDGTYGAMKTGWQWIDGYCYYFAPDGKMAENVITPDGYQVDQNGRWIENGTACFIAGKGITTGKNTAADAVSKKTGTVSGGGNGGGGSSGKGGSGGTGGGGGSSGGSGFYNKGVSESKGNAAEQDNEVRLDPVEELTNTDSSVSKPNTPSEETVQKPEVEITINHKDTITDSKTEDEIEEEKGDEEQVQDEEITMKPSEMPNATPSNAAASNAAPDQTDSTQEQEPDTKKRKDEAENVHWFVHFRDKETHQIHIMEDQDGMAQSGDTLNIHYQSRIIDEDGNIWLAALTGPMDVLVWGPGENHIYVEFEWGGVLETEEDMDIQAEEKLFDWIDQAKYMELSITGEEFLAIDDERFVVENASKNNERLYSIASQIEGTEPKTVLVIGKNYEPNGAILKCLFRSELIYSNTRLDTLSIRGDNYNVHAFVIQRSMKQDSCSHIFRTEEVRGVRCMTNGKTIYECEQCGMQEEVTIPAAGHKDTDQDGICDVCYQLINEVEKPEPVHWQLGDTVAREICGEWFLFRCIDQNYSDKSETHRSCALFLCDQILPANFGSAYTYETVDDLYRYKFHAGPIVNFGESNDYKYSKIRKFLDTCSTEFYNTEPINIGNSYAYTGATTPGKYSEYFEQELRPSYIGNQKLTGTLFALSVDEAYKYRDYLWRFDGSGTDNAEDYISEFCKAYWLRSAVGTEHDHDTGLVYVVDLVNGNIRPMAVKPSGQSDDEELKVTGITGVRPVFAVPQE